MRVAVICPYDLGAPGGVQDQAISLQRWLTDLGHAVTLVGPGADGPDGAVLIGSTRTITANASAVPIAIDPRVVGAVRDAEAGFGSALAAWLASESPPPGMLYHRALAAFEKPLIEHALGRTGGNQLRAAQLLGINRNTLRKRIGELGLEPDRFSQTS